MARFDFELRLGLRLGMRLGLGYISVMVTVWFVGSH